MAHRKSRQPTRRHNRRLLQQNLPGATKVRCSKREPHSITSSAVIRKVCGTVRPSALATFRSIMSSNGGNVVGN
jgi:hypothetical protein